MLALLTGCAAPLPPSSAIAYGEVKARFVAGHDDQVIQVRALDRLPLRSAVLVLADGKRVAAESIDAEANPRRTNIIPMHLAPNPGGGTPPQPIPFPPGGALETTETLVGQIASVALIRVPERAAYRQDWPNETIEITMGDAPDERRETLPAPPPLN